MLLVWALLLDDVTLIPKIFWKSLAFFFFPYQCISILKMLRCHPITSDFDEQLALRKSA